MSGQAGYKSRMLVVLMVVFALWASTAIADVNEDFIKAAARGDLPAVTSFIAKGADVNAKAFGVTALIMASNYGHKEVVELLLARGSNINAEAESGETASMFASQEGHKEIVQLCSPRGPTSMQRSRITAEPR